MARAAIRFGCNKVRLISARRSVQQRTPPSHNSNEKLSPLPWFAVFSVGALWYKNSLSSHPSSTFPNELDESMREQMEGNVVNREVCETKVAELKQKMESGSILEHERYDLWRYEGWLQLLTKGA